MIEVNITGGLGNQLFQYAFARYLQKETGERIVLNIFELEKYDKKRKLSLQHFLLNKEISISNKKLPWYVHRRSILSKILRKLIPNIYFKFFEKKGSYIWYGESYRKVNLPTCQKIYVGGYWQSPNYSIDALTEIQKDIVLKDDLRKDSVELLRQINNSNSVCVHIRRGDYVGTDYEVCTAEYYNKSIKQISIKDNDLTFFIFSDDVQWAQNNIEDCENIIFVNNNNEDYIDLYLMSQCKHFIISNSTFSWWAQYLGAYPLKKVYAPSKWHRKQDNSDIYCQNWVIIGVDV